MKTVIEKITPIREGEAIIVSLSLSDGVHEEKCKHEIATDLFRSEERRVGKECLRVTELR